MDAERETPDWLQLPLDMMAVILSRLTAVEIIRNAQNVCSQWRNICKDPLTWTSIDMHIPWDTWNLNSADYLHEMCFHAVDRSCGNLIHINLEYIGSDELLIYIAQRSGNLKRLRLVSCYEISNEGLIAAVMKFPFLEELEISYGSVSKDSLKNSYGSISKDTLEIIGRCCPLMKSLKYNVHGCKRFFLKCDDEALAISRTMPELRCLQLVGNRLTNYGLLAILVGCPRLESLDLRKCFNVILAQQLEIMCVERIKYLWRPNDSTHDYEFEVQDHSPSGTSCIEDDDSVDSLRDSDISDFEDWLFFERVLFSMK